MLTFTQAFILGLAQGLTELFPISSLGHSVLIPALLNWPLNENSPVFIEFLIATHVATALVLAAYFWKDWLHIIQGFFRLLGTRRTGPQDTYARLAWLIIIATIPAGFIGLIFQTKIENLFATPEVIAMVLIANGVLLYAVELLKRGRRRRENARVTGDTAIVKISWLSALGVGLMQSFALIPGFSRTGSSLAGGLIVGLDHESAARFSFLLATPIILAAGLLKLPSLVHDHTAVLQIGFGALIAGCASFLSVQFLMRYFKNNTLTPFAWYCIIAGFISLFILRSY